MSPVSGHVIGLSVIFMKVQHNPDSSLIKEHIVMLHTQQVIKVVLKGKPLKYKSNVFAIKSDAHTRTWLPYGA